MHLTSKPPSSVFRIKLIVYVYGSEVSLFINICSSSKHKHRVLLKQMSCKKARVPMKTTAIFYYLFTIKWSYKEELSNKWHIKCLAMVFLSCGIYIFLFTSFLLLKVFPILWSYAYA